MYSGEQWGTFRSDTTFFVALIRANYNRWLLNYKITQFAVFVRGSWEVERSEHSWEIGKRKQGRGGLNLVAS